MGVLVTAATKYGATTEIAQAIAAVLGEHGLEAIVLPPEQVEEVEGYDAVVVGSAVYAGHWLKPAKELVERHADLLTATGARDHRVFAGKLVRKQLSFPERAIASALRVPEGTSATGPRSTTGQPRSPRRCRPDSGSREPTKPPVDDPHISRRLCGGACCGSVG